MHDPMTVAFEIKYPWWDSKPWPKKHQHSGENGWRWKHSMTDADKVGRSQMWPEGYRNTFITIWHVDPEKDGSDDSCGWSYPKITKKQREVLKNTAWWEGREPHFLICREKKFTGSVEHAEALYRGMALLVVRVLRLKMSYDQICRYAAEAVHIRTGGDFGGAFCFLPGYHTNSQADTQEIRTEHFHGILCNVASGLLDELRPWYKRPRWHFWHWKFQCHPLLTFKRWAFSRCCKCQKGFAWGYSPVTNSWNGDGPRWFRGERDVYHSDCNKPTDHCLASNEAKTQ